MDAYLVTGAASGTSPSVDEPFTLDASDVAAAFGGDAAQPLGRGTFGETWRVRLSDGSSRAVKVLLGQQTSQQRLAREVEGLKRASSPHVVRLLDTTCVTLSGAERAVLVFEFISGGDLTGRLASGNQVDVADVVDFGAGLMGGLCALHAQDVVHRDIKPANIALRDAEWAQPVVLDLGLARMLDLDSITRYPAFMGTAVYMAPEQLRQERARKAADVFAAGVLLHLMLSGAHPFYAPDAEIRVEEAIDLISAGPLSLPDHVPDDLAALVRRLLDPREGDRGSAQRARREIDEIRSARGDLEPEN